MEIQKKIYPCNLLQMRVELNLSQKELGDILGVSPRMISKYEADEVTLPIEKAITIAQKYNYTLEWIYRFSSTAKKSDGNIQKVYPKFFVDLREFISCSNGSIYLTIPNYYMEYIRERNRIKSSKEPDRNKEQELAKLDAKYTPQEKETKYWKIPLKNEDIISYLRFDSKFVPFADGQDSSVIKPTEEQIEEVTSFLKELTMDEPDKLRLNI